MEKLIKKLKGKLINYGLIEDKNLNGSFKIEIKNDKNSNFHIINMKIPIKIFKNEYLIHLHELFNIEIKNYENSDKIEIPISTSYEVVEY